MCRLVAAQTSFYGIKKTRTHRADHREMSHCSKKNLVSRNELRETENIGATDLDELIANFLLQVREFLFLICVKKTISMKIIVLRVINAHVKEITLYGVIFTRCLCQKPSLGRTSLVRDFTRTTREYNPVRRTFYDLNYIYACPSVYKMTSAFFF